MNFLTPQPTCTLPLQFYESKWSCILEVYQENHGFLLLRAVGRMIQQCGGQFLGTLRLLETKKIHLFPTTSQALAEMEVEHSKQMPTSMKVVNDVNIMPFLSSQHASSDKDTFTECASSMCSTFIWPQTLMLVQTEISLEAYTTHSRSILTNAISREKTPKRLEFMEATLTKGLGNPQATLMPREAEFLVQILHFLGFKLEKHTDLLSYVHTT